MVGVLPDVPAIDKVFDYAVPPALDAEVRVGTIVRVSLQGRRVGGWVVADEREPPAGVRLQPIAKVTGWGPPPELVDLTAWAAWRWAGRQASILATASPPRSVRGLPAAPVRRHPVADATDELSSTALEGGRRLLRLPPAWDLLPLLVAAARRGPALLLSPSVSAAAGVARDLRSAGLDVALHPREWARARAGGVVVAGARAAAWAPLPEMAAVVVLDAHAEAYQEERAPTWHARDVAVERARRAGVPCVLVSPCPDLEMLAVGGEPLAVNRGAERAGWPVLDIIDRRTDDPRTGLFSEALASTLRRHERVVCVLNRKGRARLVACSGCGELARCERCGRALALEDEGLACRGCGLTRPAVCANCGSTRIKSLRLGVTRVREELAALTGREVGEVTAETEVMPETPILVGTEAVLHRVGEADAVAFLDFDQELLASRYRASEQALALLAMAGRIVGGRGAGGRVLVQTRLPDHDVLQAALHGDPHRLVAPERERRRTLGFPPFSAIALVSGPVAPALVERLDGVETLGPDDGRWLIRAPDHANLADAFAAAGRPPGRLRIEVDPLRI